MLFLKREFLSKEFLIGEFLEGGFLERDFFERGFLGRERSHREFPHRGFPHRKLLNIQLPRRAPTDPGISTTGQLLMSVCCAVSMSATIYSCNLFLCTTFLTA
jgi:hypothetical protein